MPSSDARTLAQLLGTRSDAELANLFAARRVAPTVSWNDAFDAAEHLLDPASLARAVTGLTAAEARALHEAVATGRTPDGTVRADLAARALLDGADAPWEAVAAALSAATTLVAASAAGATTDAAPAQDMPVAEHPAPAGERAAAQTGTASDAAEAERAFGAVSSLADVLQAALTAPLTRIGTGTLGAVDRRRLVDAGVVSDADTADDLVAIADRTGLLAAPERVWLVTPRGLAWLHTSTRERWSEVATTLVASLPPALRAPSGGWISPTEWPEAYPFDLAWPARAAAALRLLQQWSLLDASGTPPAWSAALAAGGDPDLSALDALLPPEVDRVYLQNDLTAIAPGTLAPHLDLRLRGMARRESRAQASSYRFTAETLADALTSGETADSLRTFLEELSLTGLPQPLAYEIERSAGRHGALRVGMDDTGRTRITSDDGALLRTIAVDQALRPLGLIVDGDDLVTRSSPDTAFWMIADARYPIVAVDAGGERRALDRHRLAPDPEPARTAAQVYADLIARLRAAESDDTDAAWLGRELEQAVRARATLVVTVRVRAPAGGDDAEREFVIEATGFNGGRLRGIDKNVDVERTLPVSSIVRVRPA